MKLTAHLGVDIICGECSYLLYPLPEYLPRRIVYCHNEKCSRFNVALEVKPLEVEVVRAEDILIEARK